MISLRRGAGGARIVAEDDAATVFVDRDWIGAASDGPVHSLPAADAGAAAGLLLAGADHIAGLVEGAPGGGAEVLGDGLIAISVRGALAGGGATAERPGALIDCSGDPVRLLDGIARVRDGGVVVLAGEALGREFEIDLYVDVHRRGLRIVGAPRPESHAPVTDAARVRRALGQLARVQPGAAPPTAPWFAVGPAAA